ncbi:MAG: MoaD/ThiS family protein [Bacillota bacterium]
MRVRVRLWAGLNVYRQDRLSDFDLCLEAGATVRALLMKVNVPEEMTAVITVNGQKAKLGHELSDGDCVDVYPPICGG